MWSYKLSKSPPDQKLSSKERIFDRNLRNLKTLSKIIAHVQTETITEGWIQWIVDISDA